MLLRRHAGQAPEVGYQKHRRYYTENEDSEQEN
jgi:hypothetical protein